ncbi:YceI family protein [Paraflavitalea sp. CAU 1676]|uniref:YceI family protein n=1 Tax=Paraflavitalea sp. CAU 1676 TaxID=3032598 RepID=UPI0023DC94F8|nr:YceI family protein [Paraflavitalea sp. CAU 1676]MDF2193164.1 YceI family protein [Paraflavitalea sp. CAU 1676]
MSMQSFNIVAGQSNIHWTGKKVTGSHFGTIGIKSGRLDILDGQLTGGGFVVDTTSIKIDDVADAALNKQFADHLASDDFFSTVRYPEALLVITGVQDSRVTGDLTIKGISHSVDFAAETHITGDTLKASATIVVDRTNYGIKFRSGNFFQNLGDTLIYNDFTLDVNLTAKALNTSI